jgi:hypothetical protein
MEEDTKMIRVWNRDVSEEDGHQTHHEFGSIQEAHEFLDSFCSRRISPEGDLYWVEKDIQYGASYWGVA